MKKDGPDRRYESGKACNGGQAKLEGAEGDTLLQDNPLAFPIKAPIGIVDFETTEFIDGD